MLILGCILGFGKGPLVLVNDNVNASSSLIVPHAQRNSIKKWFDEFGVEELTG